MSKILVFVASHFEDVELITTLDVLSRNKISYDLVSIENLDFVPGKYNAIVKTQNLDRIADFSHYIGLFLPGGPGHEIILNNYQVIEIIKDFAARDKIISAICAAPYILWFNGLLKDRVYTSHPEFAQSENNTGQEVEVDNNLVTGRDYLATPNFAKALVKTIEGRK